MLDATSSAAPSWTLTVTHWVLTRILGGILFFALLVGTAAAYDATHPVPPTARPELFEGGGMGLNAVLYAAWGIGFDCLYTLPLLLLLPWRIRRALTKAAVTTRRKLFVGAVGGWHLVLPTLAAIVVYDEGNLLLALGLLGLGCFYALVAVYLGWKLYAHS
jgi:hypothetical protein